MIADVLSDATERMNKAVEVAKDDFGTVRTGRANPALFQKILVDYYGTPTPLAQLAALAEPRGAHAARHPYDKTRAQGDREGDPQHAEPRRQPSQRRQRSSASPCPSSPRTAARSSSRSSAARARTPRSRSATSAARPRTTSTRSRARSATTRSPAARRSSRRSRKTHVDADRRGPEAQGSRTPRGLGELSEDCVRDGAATAPPRQTR